MKTMHLNLHKKWFDMIKSGEKKEEYREITGYWAVRLIENWKSFSQNAKDMMLTTMNNTSFEEYELKECIELDIKAFDIVHFKNGFARNGKPAPSFDVGLKTIRVGQGKREWGAEPGKRYFVLELGKIIEQANKGE
jgi:uncharacterized protein (DUF736 family)